MFEVGKYYRFTCPTYVKVLKLIGGPFHTSAPHCREYYECNMIGDRTVRYITTVTLEASYTPLAEEEVLIYKMAL
jgi:hypothetical protein